MFLCVHLFQCLLTQPAPKPSLSQAHAAHGVNTIRVFAHSDGYGFPNNIPTPDPIQPELGVYNEVALQRCEVVAAGLPGPPNL